MMKVTEFLDLAKVLVLAHHRVEKGQADSDLASKERASQSNYAAPFGCRAQPKDEPHQHRVRPLASRLLALRQPRASLSRNDDQNIKYTCSIVLGQR